MKHPNLPPPSYSHYTSPSNRPSTSSSVTSSNNLPSIANMPGGSRQPRSRRGSSLADEDEQDTKDLINEDGSSSGRKRPRVHFSCTECHRRKQKCNRETPCNHCIARKVPDRCRTFQPGEETPEVPVRLTRLERSIEEGLDRIVDRLDEQARQIAKLQQMSTASHNNAVGGSSHPFSSYATAGGSDQDYFRQLPPISISSGAPRFPVAQSATRDRPYGNGSRPSRIVVDNEPGSASDEDEPATSSRLSPKGTFIGRGAVGVKSVGLLLESAGGDSGAPPPSFYDPVRAVDRPSTIALDECMNEMGATTNNLSKSLILALPTVEEQKILLDHFFEDVNWLRQPLPQRSLRKCFDALMASGPTLTAQNINIYALLVTTLAIASMSAPQSLYPEGQQQRRMAGRIFHLAGRRALLMAGMIGTDDVEQVLAWTMACRFCLLDRRIGEAWTCAANATKAAHSIGLHRDGSYLGLNEAESELRRRVWAAVYFADRILSLNLGRPTSIDDAFCDTRDPSIVDEEGIFPAPDPGEEASLPPGIKAPTAMSHTTHRAELARFMGRIMSTYQNLKEQGHYPDCLQIDKDLLAYRESLPSHFRSPLNDNGQIESDESLDKLYPFLPVHRFLLETEVNFLRTTLHRPYLLRSAGKGAHGARYLPSRRVCIEAAHHDILLRRDFVAKLKKNLQATRPGMPTLHYQVHIGTYKWFSSLLICGLVLILEPTGKDASMMREHLEDYLKHHEIKKASGETRDELRDREAQIVSLFLAKADALREGKGSAMRKRDRAGSGADGLRSDERRKALRRAEVSDADEQTHATAGLLLGLGGKNNGAAETRSSPSFSPSTNSVHTAPYAKDSPLFRAGGEATSTHSPNSSTTNTTPNTGGMAEDAQRYYDAWYQASFAAGGSVLDAAFMQQTPSYNDSTISNLIASNASALPASLASVSAASGQSPPLADALSANTFQPVPISQAQSQAQAAWGLPAQQSDAGAGVSGVPQAFASLGTGTPGSSIASFGTVPAYTFASFGGQGDGTGSASSLVNGGTEQQQHVTATSGAEPGQQRSQHLAVPFGPEQGLGSGTSAAGSSFTAPQGTTPTGVNEFNFDGEFWKVLIEKIAQS